MPSEGHFVRHELRTDEQSCSCGPSMHGTGVDDISSNVLEPSGMLAGALTLVGAERCRPGRTIDCVTLLGINEPSVAWMRRCGGGKEPRSGVVTRVMDALEVSSGCF